MSKVIDVTSDMVPFLIKHRIPVYRGSYWPFNDQDMYDGEQMSGFIICKDSDPDLVVVDWIDPEGYVFHRNVYSPRERNLSVWEQDLPDKLRKLKYTLKDI